MRFATVTVLCAASFMACDRGPYVITSELPDAFCNQGDLKSSTADLLPNSGSCSAAKGLSGTNLFCVDLPPVQTLDALRGLGVGVGKDTSNNECWELMGGKLQIKNFSGFMGNCSLTLPATDLTTGANQKYNSITLSILHKADLIDPDQVAQVFLGAVDPKKRLLFQTNGHQQRQQSIVTLAKVDLPTVVNGVYQPLLQLFSGVAAGGTAQGWQIESIAVNASP